MKILTVMMDEMIEFFFGLGEVILVLILAIIMLVLFPVWVIPYIAIKKLKRRKAGNK